MQNVCKIGNTTKQSFIDILHNFLQILSQDQLFIFLVSLTILTFNKEELNGKLYKTRTGFNISPMTQNCPFSNSTKL